MGYINSEKNYKAGKNERVVCPVCKKLKIKYLKNNDYCQKCYREILSKYSFYKYKDENKKPKFGSTEYKVCDIMIYDNIKPKKLVEKYGAELKISSVKYVFSISEKYLEKCDTYGNPRPEINKSKK